MRIGIDIDDTISDTYEVVVAYAQKYTINELNKEEKLNDIIAQHHSYVAKMHNWNYDEEVNFWQKYYGEIIKNVKPFTFSVETINKLRDEGNKIVIVTARWPEPNWDVNELSRKWLKENNINYDDIVFNAQDKGKVAVEKKLDLLIDDSFQNCKSVADKGIKSFIIQTRINKGLEDKRITRVYSWPDIYNRIKEEKF